MKLRIAIMTFLASTQSFAGPACGAFYTASVGHVFKGMAREIGDKEKIKEGEVAKDELYTVSVANGGVPTVKETKSGKTVPLKAGELVPGTVVYATKTLKLFPEGVPGTFAENRFILILCADESAF